MSTHLIDQRLYTYVVNFIDDIIVIHINNHFDNFESYRVPCKTFFLETCILKWECGKFISYYIYIYMYLYNLEQKHLI